MRRDDYLLVCSHLRIAVIMLRCAQGTMPGPDRIARLWSAGASIADARRVAKFRRIKLRRRIAILNACLRKLDRYAGEGEFIGDAFEGEVLIISRDANGRWSERRERVH